MRARRGMVRLVALLSCVTVAELAAQAVDTAYARVTYVSGASLYIDAGERDGLTESSQLEVIRGRTVIGRLRVMFLSPSRAQCSIESSSVPPEVGDSVRFVRLRAPAIARDTQVAPIPALERPAPRSGATLRGRVGVRYFASWQRDSGDAQWSQPMSDVHLEGPVPRFPSLSVALDARGRRTRSVTIAGLSQPAHTSTTEYQAS